MTNLQDFKVKPGDRVRVECSSEVKDKKTGVKRLGTEVFEFTVGSRDVMPGINKAVVGMVEGERKQLTLLPRDAYGEFRPQLIREISRDRLPERMSLRVGKKLTTVGVKTRRKRTFTVVELKSKSVVVDGNHALAGKTLEAEIQLLVRNPAVKHEAKPNDRGEA